jgi:hypothetical protein
MLNYETCLRCWIDAVKDEDVQRSKKNFDDYWNVHHLCYCIQKEGTPYFRSIFIKTTSNPPKTCPYLLEHTVTAETSFEPVESHGIGEPIPRREEWYQ